MKAHELDSQRSAYSDQSGFYDENVAMLSWYARRIVRTCRTKSYRSLLSLGIGHQTVPRAIFEELGTSLTRYAVVEGSLEIIEAVRSSTAIPPNTQLIHSLFEEFQPVEQVDAVEMGFVLEHVEDPEAIVRQYSQVVKAGGSMFIAVPNARSLHRLVGHEAGLLENPYQLSAEDVRLGHRRYFDCDSLSKLVVDAGLKIVSLEGMLLKPLTSGQLRSLNLPAPVLEAFIKVGVTYPRICNAIFIEASL